MGRKGSVALMWVVLATLTAGCQTQKTNPYNGRNLYLGYCAACHGGAGAGDGPVARSLNVPIPDLRKLAANNGGVSCFDPSRDVWALFEAKRADAVKVPVAVSVWVCARP